MPNIVSISITLVLCFVFNDYVFNSIGTVFSTNYHFFLAHVSQFYLSIYLSVSSHLLMLILMLLLICHSVDLYDRLNNIKCHIGVKKMCKNKINQNHHQLQLYVEFSCILSVRVTMRPPEHALATRVSSCETFLTCVASQAWGKHCHGYTFCFNI